MPRIFHSIFAAIAMLMLAGTATAQPLKVVAIPPLATPKNVDTEAGQTGVLGIQIAQMIATDIRQSGAAFPTGPEKMRSYSPTEAGAPQYAQWASTGASALVTGYVQARSDGRLTVVCYLYDTRTRREMTRKGFAVPPEEWRRAAHQCSDAFYAALTGKKGFFDSRIAYVAETGSVQQRIKRLAIMDYDGTNHRYLTAGEVTVLSPRFSPDGSSLAYVSFSGSTPHVRVLDISSGADRPLVPPAQPAYPTFPYGAPPGFALPSPPPPPMSFAPAYSPDGRQIVFSMAVNGNTDLYIAPVGGGNPQRITTSLGTDTSPSFSPDGRQIAFESDRSGSPQIYVMDVDGPGERRISFGSGSFAAPAWSPDGEWIAYSRHLGGNSRVGIVRPDGRQDRMLTDGWQDESPSWSPGSEQIVFARTEQGSGRASLHMVAISGGTARRLAAPQGASDPSWSPLPQ